MGALVGRKEGNGEEIGALHLRKASSCVLRNSRSCDIAHIHRNEGGGPDGNRPDSNMCPSHVSVAQRMV